MPTPKKPISEGPPPKQLPTIEVMSFVGGLYAEFHEQLHRYQQLTADLLALEARIEVVEKNLCVTRDHLAMAIEKSEEPVPKQWQEHLKEVRFVGMRLSDACLILLREHKKMSYIEMLNALNEGTYRFRTNSPAREIHGALLRQRNVKRTSDGWVWTGSDEQSLTQPTLRLLAKTDATREKK